MLPEFSVVIPAYKQPALLLKCLDALGHQLLPRHQFEIIVVDECNSSETEMAVQLFAKQIAHNGSLLEVRYLGQSERRGPAAARNRGWRAARGRVIAFTDEDCLPEPAWLSSASACFQRGAQVLSGQLRVRLPQQPSLLDRTATLLKRTEFIAANCFCLKSTLERVNGFEEAFDTAWREDCDLQFKFIQAGIPIGKCPQAVVVYPIQPGPWYSLLRDERNNSYDALLYKRHPSLFRERIPVCRHHIFQNYTAVLSLTLCLLALLGGHQATALISLSIWAVVSASLIGRHLPHKTLTFQTARHVLLTALATPFLSVYWRLHGAYKYKVLYW